MNRSKQFCVLEAFRKILRQELQYIQQRPDILWQQMYNRLQWVEESVKEYIEPEHRIRNSTGARPWIRFKTPFLESGALIQTFARHSDNVSCCAVSPDGSFFVTASADKTLKIWDFFTGRERATLSGHHHGVNFCAISPDSSFIVSAGIDKTL